MFSSSIDAPLADRVSPRAVGLLFQGSQSLFATPRNAKSGLGGGWRVTTDELAPPTQLNRRMARPRTQKKAGSIGHTPGEFGYEASTAKASRQSPIIVRLGTDSVNLFRQQIYKTLVSVALEPQKRTGSSSTVQGAAGSGVVTGRYWSCFLRSS